MIEQTINPVNMFVKTAPQKLQKTEQKNNDKSFLETMQSEIVKLDENQSKPVKETAEEKIENPVDETPKTEKSPLETAIEMLLGNEQIPQNITTVDVLEQGKGENAKVLVENLQKVDDSLIAQITEQVSTKAENVVDAKVTSEAKVLLPPELQTEVVQTELKNTAPVSTKPVDNKTNVKVEIVNTDILQKDFVQQNLTSEVNSSKKELQPQLQAENDEKPIDNVNGEKPQVKAIVQDEKTDTEQKTQNNPISQVATEPVTFEKTVVKISDAKTNLDKTPKAQIAENVKVNLNNGKKEFTMQLNPQNLGKVDVKLVVEKGVLTVSISAHNPKTQSLLVSQAGEIKELIQSQTHNQTQVLAKEPEQQAQNYTEQQSKHNNPEQQQHQEQKKETATSTVDFLNVLKELKNQIKTA